MDRNLERNLAKIESLRAKGDLPKARRKLTELLQDHSDTPPYRLELARICFDLGDSHAGLSEIRTLLRLLPEDRQELLALVQDHFQASGSLPSAQFLVEDHLQRDEHDDVTLIMERLTEPQIQQVSERNATKIASLKSHGDLAGDGSADAGVSLRLALWGSFHCAVALKEFAAIAAHGFRLLRGGEADRQALLGLLERRARTQEMPPPLLALLGEARAREGRLIDGLSALLAAAERDQTWIDRIEEIVRGLPAGPGEETAVLRTRGHLARLAKRSDEAVALYREAVTRDPQGIASLLELLAPAADAEGPEARPYALLRVELMARSGNGAALTATLEQLRRRTWFTPEDLRSALAPHLREGAAPGLIACAGLLAIESGQCQDLDTLLDARPALSRVQITPLVKALERRLGLTSSEPEVATDPITGELVNVTTPKPASASAAPLPDHRRWLRALVRLHAVGADVTGANARLALLWREANAADEDEYAALLALTSAVFAVVPPTAETLAALLGPVAAHGEASALRPWLAALDGDPLALASVADALVDVAQRDEAQARALGEAMAELTGTPAAALVLPRVAARLFGGDEDAALRDLESLMASRPGLEERGLELLLARSRRQPPHAGVALAAARLLRVEDRIEEAVGALQPVLEQDPQRAEEVCLFFESVLASEPERVDVWLAYLEGLLHAGRYRRLLQVLPKAEQALPAAEIGRLRGYRARLLFEDGDLSGALAECELALQLADPPLAKLAELLQAIVAVKPGLGRAHKLLGDVAAASGHLDEGLRRHAQALRSDPALRGEVLHAARRLSSDRMLGGADCLALARFYLEAGRGDEAAAAYLEALQVDSARAAEIADELGESADDSSPFPALLQPYAQALRLAGRTEAAEAAYTALYARDTSRADWIFKELALLEAAHPEALAPVRARARILLAEKRLDDLDRLLQGALARSGYAEARWLLAREFAHNLGGNETLLVLAIAAAVETGHHDEAWDWLRAWTARKGQPREYARVCAVLEQLCGAPQGWPQRDAVCRVHWRGGRPDLALAALPPAESLTADELAAAWATLEALATDLAAQPSLPLLRARYLHALGRTAEALVALDSAPAAPSSGARGESGEERARPADRGEAAVLRGQLLAELGRHDEARQAIQDLLQTPGSQADALAFLRTAHAAQAQALAERGGGEEALAPEERREVARRLALAGRAAEGLRLLAEPCNDQAHEQARRLAEAEMLVALDRPLEAAERLRQVPLAGEKCRLAPADRARALWLLAHGEEARGGWAAACACYRALTALPGDPDGARRWLNLSYGRFLQQTVTPTPLILEKTAALD